VTEQAASLQDAWEQWSTKPAVIQQALLHHRKAEEFMQALAVVDGTNHNAVPHTAGYCKFVEM
jgi:hypothetical protein